MQGKKTELTNEQIKKINLLYNDGLNRNDVAKTLNVSVWSVRKTLKGKFRNKSEQRKIFSLKNEEILSHHQTQCILGTLLGDASLIYRRELFEYHTSHCLEQKEYCEHIASVLNRNTCEYIKNKNSFSAGKKYYKTSFNNKVTLEKISNIVCVKNKKRVTKKWCDNIDAIAIAYWFMDDGSSTRLKKSNTVVVRFSTLSFSLKEIKNLQKRLVELGIKTYRSRHSKRSKTNIQQYELCVKQNYINIFFDLIEEYIIPSMKYKVKRKE